MPRVSLPNHRESRTIRINHIWAPGTVQAYAEEFTITFSAMPNGESIGEVFYNHDGDGSTSNERVAQFRREACILISTALQWGVPLQILRDAMVFERHNLMGEDRILPHTIFGAILEALGREQGLPAVELPEDVLEGN